MRVGAGRLHDGAAGAGLPAGRDFVHEMQQAATSAARTIAVLSPAYFGSRFGEAEWRAAFVKDPTGRAGSAGAGAGAAVRAAGVAGQPGVRRSGRRGRGRRPGSGCWRRSTGIAAAPDHRRVPRRTTGACGRRVRFPGRGPAVSNLPARNRNFSGRDELLEQLHAELQAESAAAVVPVEAVHGLGGVGKTELAVEFAHRFGSDYDMVWWIPAEQPTAAVAALAALAGRLGVPAAADQTETGHAAVRRCCAAGTAGC